MKKPDLPLSTPLLPPPRPRFVYRIRAWLRTRTGRIVFPLITWFIGLLIGIMIVLSIALGGDGQLHATPKLPVSGDIIVEADKTYLTDLIMQDLQSAGLPGTVKNVRVTLVNGDQMTITGDDEFSFLGFGMTRNFTVVVQPYVTSCVLQVHVVHVDLNSIPVTGFVSAFEENINSQLQMKPTGLPSGFTYCTVGVRTETGGLFISYAATPV
ncbi:MAG TPA: hypothetical protein VFA09_25670 [Ktedonobacteraceae bacterium]|nr:hypothetical protein [Ktedonobacteraceae bacterium]